jgi:hypothetical protein
MSATARTPEELETLLEDSLLTRDSDDLTALFEEISVLDSADEWRARGGKEIARLALATWDGTSPYLADPRRIVQAHDIALIVADRTVNVARRGRDGAWRYVIVCRSVVS